MILRALAIPVAACAIAAQTPTFRTTIDTVHVDVSVLDRDRRPVRGLKPADFTIFEDGAPQEISVFQAVDVPESTTTLAAWTREVASDVLRNDTGLDQRLFLIVMDDATLQSDLHAIGNAKRIAQRFIDRLGPSDVAAVVFTRDNRHAQDYTSDRARLRTAVDHVSAGFRDMGAFDVERQQPLPGQDDYFFEGSVRVLQDAVRYLTTMPDRRKVMVYVGQGLPFDTASLAAPAAGLPQFGGASSVMRAGMMSRVKELLERLFRDAGRANVNVYALDVCGLRAPTLSTGRAPTPTCVPGPEVDYLKTVANATGGRAITDTNDFEPGLQAVFDENASYYLLGYRPADGGRDGKLHRIEVRVNRRGVQVRTRSGYEAESPKDDRKRVAMAAAPLDAAIAGALPKRDLPLQMSAVAFDLPGRRESAVAVTIGIQQPIRAAGTTERVDLQVRAFDVNGKAFASRRLQADVKIRADASGLAEYEVLTRIDLPPGRYQLRGAASVRSLGTSGSVYYDVDVPDVDKPPVSLSGLVLDASPRPIISPRDALRGVLDVVPTNRRTFAGGDRAAAFLRVYQGGKRPLRAVPLRVRLTDQHGAVIVDRPEELAAARFSSARSADVRIDLPVGRMAAGDYLLSIDADSGAAVRQARVRVN
jgi:VWFA-related protein